MFAHTCRLVCYNVANAHKLIWVSHNELEVGKKNTKFGSLEVALLEPV